MNKPIVRTGVVAVWIIVGVVVASAAESPVPSPTATVRTDLDALVGRPVDIAPWAYEWRADLTVQEKPEAYFIPRRLERMDKVYRTVFSEMPEEERKSINYQMPELLEPLLPPPEGDLLAGLLWTGRLDDYRVALHWPARLQKFPSPDDVEVRTFPTAYGWFGWSKDRILDKPTVSADRRTWTYQCKPSTRIPAHVYKDGKDWYCSGSATELIAVFGKGGKTQGEAGPPVPHIRVTSPNLGTWERMDVEIEWGFQEGTEKNDFEGRVESYVAMTGPVVPLAEDKGTTVTGEHTWQSRAAGDGRRGIVVSLLYTPGGQPALDSRVTVWTKTSGFTFRVRDLENGPILIPEHGVFITKAGSGKTAREFRRELAARKLKSIRRMTNEHPEASSWDELLQEVRLRTCPAGTPVPPFPQVPDPPMRVQLSDARWTDAWRAVSFQMRGRHAYEGLAFEGARTAHDMDLAGLHDEADKIYEHFLKSPGAKSDGDYPDGNGALEWAAGIRHDMGYEQDGTHAATGRLLFAMADRYFLTGDKEWFRQKRDRLQAAADWIIRQRKLYVKDIPGRRDLSVAGLMPPCMLGDYALPSCEWRWYFGDNAFALQGLQRFADALAEFDAEAARKYQEEAKAFRDDLRRAVDREAALSPVRLGCDGTYRSYIAPMAYTRGTMPCLEFGTLNRPQLDIILGALPLAEPFAALDADDPRVVGTLNAMEEIGTSPKVTQYVSLPNIDRTMDVMEAIVASVKSGRKLDEAWFWNCYGSGLPKSSHIANIYLLQDEVPSFLRFWMNSYAAMVGADGRLWEWGHLGDYANCTWADNGTAGWFLENFRNLLVMEEDQSLWIARATPRAWLEQGKKIVVKDAPTYFGTLAYEIDSDVDNGKINATVEIPTRRSPRRMVLRFRHPKATPIRSVTVNGRPWARFDKDKETIVLTGLTGKVAVVATY